MFCVGDYVMIREDLSPDHYYHAEGRHDGWVVSYTRCDLYRGKTAYIAEVNQQDHPRVPYILADESGVHLGYRWNDEMLILIDGNDLACEVSADDLDAVLNW